MVLRLNLNTDLKSLSPQSTNYLPTIFHPFLPQTHHIPKQILPQSHHLSQIKEHVKLIRHATIRTCLLKTKTVDTY